MVRTSPVRVSVFCLCLAAATAGDALAQSPAIDGFVTIKGGLNREQAEDGLRGRSAAGGLAAGIALGEQWSGEIELWLPAPTRENPGATHRDVLVSFSTLRRFRFHGARPFAVVGVSGARTQNSVTSCFADRLPGPGSATPVRAAVSCDEPDVYLRVPERFDTLTAYVLLGGGIEVPIAGRVRFLTDVRLNVASTSVIVRPSVGLTIGF